MSLLTILVLTSLVAAIAFFLAGYLLRPSGARPPVDASTAAVPGDDLDRLREENETIKQALAEARAESERLGAKERQASERLRAAEDHNRAAFEQEESNALAFQAQLDAIRADHQRRDEGLRKELTQARSDLAAGANEHTRLEHKLREQGERAARAEQALSESQTRERASDSKLDEARRQELEQSKRMAAEAEARGRSAEARAAESEARRQAMASRLATGEELERAAQARLAALEAERANLEAQLGEERRRGLAANAQTERLTLAVRAAEAALERERAQASSATGEARAAQAQRAEMERLAEENAELRAQQSDAEREAMVMANREGEVRDAKVELAAAQAKLDEMERTLEENRRLRDEVAELRTHAQASEELDRLTAAHKQLRLDAELMARRLQELKLDQAELVPLRAQAAEAASLTEEVAYLRRREKDLEAQLYANGFYASREMPAVSGELLAQKPVSDMETNLHTLVGEGGPRSAVLADAQGFLIASAGESVAQEGLAAFAAVAGEMVARARALLPLADVDSVRVVDRNSMVLTCHLFDSAGEGLGIATLGPGEPKPENTVRAVAELAAIVSGPEPGSEDAEAPEPVPTTR